jgi:hypothetical protein
MSLFIALTAVNVMMEYPSSLATLAAIFIGDCRVAIRQWNNAKGQNLRKNVV